MGLESGQKKTAPGVPQSEELGKPPRRAVLLGLASLFAVGKSHTADAREAAAAAQPTVVSLEEGPKSGREVAMGDLEGQTFSDLYAKYTGIKGRVPRVATIDFGLQLEFLWKEKNELSKGSKDAETVNEVSKKLTASYDPKSAEHMSFEAYLHRTEQSLFAPRSIALASYDRVSRDLTLSRAKFFMQVASTLSARDLTASAFTELMPGKNGVLNRNVFSFLLKEAGLDYVERIPALGDKLVSVGQYQMTPQGTATSVGAFLGAAHAQPGSVETLQGDAHHQSAFMLALENMRQLLKVKLLSEREVEDLSAHFDEIREDVALFIGSAHHSPMAARASFAHFAKAYLAFKGAKYLPQKTGNKIHSIKPSFTMFAEPKVRTYSEKLQANRQALQTI